MAQQHQFEIRGAVDIELGTDRPGLLRYRLFLPDDFLEGDRANGLVIFIPGFGADNEAGYIDGYCSWLADQQGLACVTVGYHAQGCRVTSGAQRRFTQPDADRLVEHCVRHGVSIQDGDGPGAMLDRLHHAYRDKIAAGQASGVITLTCGLIAAGGERQNFGLMQAMDHLHALADLRGKLDYDRRNVIAIGSSHGGYLAQLLAKLAPNTLRAVFDNAGYVQPPDRYINGREANLPDFIERYSEVMQMYFFLESMWSLDQAAPNAFHDDARALRCLSEQAHVQMMASAGSIRTRYRCVHGPDDAIAPTKEKAAYCQSLLNAGFDVQYKCMGPSDVDGRYVKSLDHGLGLSLRGFFERSMSTLSDADLAGPESDWGGDDFSRATNLSYRSAERVYRFVYSDKGVAHSLAALGKA